MDERCIHVHRAAPDKPAPGQPCNGCGVCCLLETCPPGRIRFLQIAGPCPALRWMPEDRRYACGLLQTPSEFCRWLPKRWNTQARQLMRRWVAAGAGCDCTAETLNAPGE